MTKGLFYTQVDDGRAGAEVSAARKPASQKANQPLRQSRLHLHRVRYVRQCDVTALPSTPMAKWSVILSSL